MFEPITDDTGALRLVFSRPIEADQAGALRAALDSIASHPGGAVVLDFTGVSLIDGSGVGAIAFLFKRLHAQGRPLSIVGAAGQPLALLRRLGVAGLLGVPAEGRKRPLFARGAWARARVTSWGRLIAG
jgi:anti-anti-sigma regulatory factor